MCHLFIVGRFVCRLFLCLPSHYRGALWIGNGKVAGLNTHIAWRIEGINRIIVINIVKSKLITVQWRKGLEDRAQCARKNYFPFPTSIFSSYVQWTSQTRMLACFRRKKKEKWLAKRKFILICFRRMTTTATTMTTTTTTEKYGALEYKKRRMCCHSQGNDTTIFMYYAENLHSLRLGFKTFYKWEREGERERAWDARRKKRTRWIARAVESSMKSYGFKLQQTNQCKTIEQARSGVEMRCRWASKCIGKPSRVRMIWIVWKGWAFAVHSRWNWLQQIWLWMGIFRVFSCTSCVSLLFCLHTSAANQAL